jgi:prevent-host-death family protein
VADISARDLRDNVSGVLRRVEAGERLRVNVGGRPVAELGPIPGRPETTPWEVFLVGGDDWRADAGLAKELAELLAENTDDVLGPP